MKIILKSNAICIGDHCDTLLLSYADNRDVFDFNYTDAPNGFEQQVRIPATLQNPEHQRNSSVYRTSSGRFVQTGVTIDKNFTLRTDWMDDTFTDAITTASGHKTFKIDGVAYSGHGDFDETHNDEDNLIQVTMKIFEQEYNQTNISC